MGMVLTTKFYNYLHQLEADGSISRFDWNSPELKRLHDLASGTLEDRRDRCIKLLERGFDKWEISANVDLTVTEIDRIRRSVKISTIPHFNYLIDGIFYADLNAVRKMLRVPTTALAVQYLRERKSRAFHLDHFYWDQVPMGSHMITSDGTLHIKKSNDIRTFRQF